MEKKHVHSQDENRREREKGGGKEEGREGERERMISKNGATLARWKRGVIEGWLTILRVFPPPMAVALPTGALPHPFLQPLSPFSTSQKPSPSSSSPYRPSSLLPPRWCELKGANSRSFEIQDRKLDGRLPPIEIPAKRERYEGGTAGPLPLPASLYGVSW